MGMHLGLWPEGAAAALHGSRDSHHRPVSRMLGELDGVQVSSATLLGVCIGLVVAGCLVFFFAYQVS
jgi:hypothetical protein